jgi:hypothetical protein
MFNFCSRITDDVNVVDFTHVIKNLEDLSDFISLAINDVKINEYPHITNNRPNNINTNEIIFHMNRVNDNVFSWENIVSHLGTKYVEKILDHAYRYRYYGNNIITHNIYELLIFLIDSENSNKNKKIKLFTIFEKYHSFDNLFFNKLINKQVIDEKDVYFLRIISLQGVYYFVKIIIKT